jgi:hypothetical protein
VPETSSATSSSYAAAKWCVRYSGSIGRMVSRFTVFTVLWLSACGGKQAPPAAETNPPALTAEQEHDALLNKASELTDRMCRCTDMACAAAIQKEVKEFRSAQPSSDVDAQLTEAQSQRKTELSLKYENCSYAARTGPPLTPEEERAVFKAEDERLDKLSEFSDRVCKCPDKECGSAINTELMEYLKPRPGYTGKRTEAQAQRQTEIAHKFSNCSSRLKPAPPAPLTAEEERAAAAETDITLDGMAKLAEKMCSCRDRPCIDTVDDERAAYVKTRKTSPRYKLTAAQQQRQTEISKKDYKCTLDARQPKTP